MFAIFLFSITAWIPYGNSKLKYVLLLKEGINWIGVIMVTLIVQTFCNKVYDIESERENKELKRHPTKNIT